MANRMDQQVPMGLNHSLDIAASDEQAYNRRVDELDAGMHSLEDILDKSSLRFENYLKTDNGDDTQMGEHNMKEMLQPHPPTLTVTHMDQLIDRSVPSSSIGYFNDNQYIDVPQQVLQKEFDLSNLQPLSLMGDVDLNMELSGSNYPNISFADSTTLGSESRTSNEYFSRISNEFYPRDSNELFSRESTELFDSSLSNVVSLEEVESRKSRFNSISNSLSSIFKNDNKPSRFNLRGINPLSTTNRDPAAMTPNIPNNLESIVENLSIDAQNQNDSAHPCIQNLHVKNCDCVSKKKRSTTNSILSSLTNARLGFNSSKTVKKPIRETVIKEEMEIDTEILVNGAVIDFDQELERVISLASKQSSSYNFNSARTSTDTRYTDARTETSTHDDLIKLDPTTVKDEKQSPDYAALFSDVPLPKKRSKTLSFKKKSLASLQQQNQEPIMSFGEDDGEDDEEKDEHVDDSLNPDVISAEEAKPERIKEYPSIAEDGSVHIIPMKESTRGRKPSLEYDASKTFVCSSCGRRFRRQEHLKRHYRSIHTNQKPFDCPKCSKKFSRSDNLVQHIKTHERE